MKDIHIRLLEDHDRKKLAERTSVFMTQAWQQAIGQEMEQYVVANKGNVAIAHFSIFVGEKMGASFAITAPLTPHCGLLFVDKSKKLSSAQTFEKNIHKAVVTFLDARGDSVMDINLPHWIKDTQEYVWADFDVTPRYTYLLDLSSSESALLEAMSASKRQNVNKGIKDDLRVERSDDVEEILAIIKKTFHSKGEAFHEEKLMNILHSSGLANHRYAYITYLNDRPSACVLVVHDEINAFYLLGGYDRENSHEGSGSLAMWKAILEAKKKGLQQFDFLGSMIPEVERYIRGFGGELTPYFCIQKRTVMADVFMKITGRKR